MSAIRFFARCASLAALLLPTAVMAADLATLAGSEWGVGEGDPRVVQFQPEDKVIGDGGCNRFMGSYKQEGAWISIGPIGTTRKACEENVMKGEQAFFAILEAAAKIDVSHLALRLLDAQGNELVALKRRDFD